MWLPPACSGFKAIANKLIVSPIVATLVFSTTPEVAREWVESICRDWNFRQIIPAHFTAPIPATPTDLRAAFSFVYPEEQEAAKPAGMGLLGGLLSALRPAGGSGSSSAPRGVVFPEEDIKALNSAKEFLKSAGVVNK